MPTTMEFENYPNYPREFRPGDRVVRGPTWAWGEQDGGQGPYSQGDPHTTIHAGTVTESDSDYDSYRTLGSSYNRHGVRSRWISVNWDHGFQNNYRVGHTNIGAVRRLPTGREVGPGPPYLDIVHVDMVYPHLLGMFRTALVLRGPSDVDSLLNILRSKSDLAKAGVPVPDDIDRVVKAVEQAAREDGTLPAWPIAILATDRDGDESDRIALVGVEEIPSRYRVLCPQAVLATFLDKIINT